MKSIVKSILALGVAVAAFASCNKNEPIELNNEPVLTITASNPEVLDTKTEMNASLTPLWSKGDKISIVFTNGATVRNNQFSTSLSEATETASFSGTASPDDDDKTLYGFYPSNKNEVSSSFVAGVPFLSEQNPSLTSFDGNTDVMVAETMHIESAISNSKLVDTRFLRLGAIVKLVLSDSSNELNGETVFSVSLTADSDLVGTANVDLVNAALDGWNETADDASKTVTAQYTADWSVNGENAVYYVVYPQVLEAGSKLIISGETSGHTFTKEVTLKSDIDLAQGAVTTLKAKVAGVETKSVATFKAVYTVETTSSVTATNAPANSTATFASTNTSTTTEQMAQGKSQTLTLNGYDGCTITAITLSMKSNTSKGAGSFTAKVGSTTISSIASANFNDASWNGAWSTSYVNIYPEVTATTVDEGESVVLTVSGTANSIYCQSYTITYTKSTTPVVVVPAPVFDVAAGTYTEDQLVLIDNYSEDYLYAYTTDGTDPAFDEELNVTNGTEYDKDSGIEVTASCTVKAIAVDVDGNTSAITTAEYVINKPLVYASLEDLVAAEITSGSTVTVSFEDAPIKSIYTTTAGYRNGVYFDIQKDSKDIEIYFKDVPEAWVAGGKLSGTLTCTWTKYNSTWELVPASDWAWTNLTYTEPAIANTADHPYTTQEAIAIIDSGVDLNTAVYVTGTISKVESFNSKYGSITYWLDNDTFEVYGGLGLDGAKFTAATDLHVGDEVVVYGTLTKYTDTATGSSTYEFSMNSKLISRNTQETQISANLTLGTYKTAMTVGDDADTYSVTYDGDGALSAVSSKPGIATVSISGTSVTVTPVAAGSTTITIAAEATENYYEISKEYTLTVSASGTYIVLFGSTYKQEGVNGYRGTSFSSTNNGFTVNLENFSNYNNAWDYVKTGNKTEATVGTITTDAAISEGISTVTITISAVTAADEVNSIKLYSGSSSSTITTEEGEFTVAAGEQKVTIETPTTGKFYKIVFDCAKGSKNGIVTVSKVVFTPVTDEEDDL